MSTVEATILVSCPDWCELTAQEHADDLWNWGGMCLHRSEEIYVKDHAGLIHEPGAERKYCDPIRIELGATRAPDGRAQGTPNLIVAGNDVSLTQASDLAYALLELVKVHREEAGLTVE